MHYVKFSSVTTKTLLELHRLPVCSNIYYIYIYTYAHMYVCIFFTQKPCESVFMDFCSSMFRGNLLPLCTQEESCIPKHKRLASTLWIAQYILKIHSTFHWWAKKNWVTYLGKQKNSRSFISLNNLEWMKNCMLLFRLRKDFLLFCSVMKLKWSQWFLHISKHRLNITNYTADRLHH